MGPQRVGHGLSDFTFLFIYLALQVRSRELPDNLTLSEEFQFSLSKREPPEAQVLFGRQETDRPQTAHPHKRSGRPLAGVWGILTPGGGGSGGGLGTAFGAESHAPELPRAVTPGNEGRPG